MGRPINKKFFLRGGIVPSESSIANGYYGLTASVSTTGTWYPVGTTITIAKGQIGNESVTATATLTANLTTGTISSILIVNPGSGYNAAPTYTINQPATVNYDGYITTGSFTITNLTGVAGIAIGQLVSEVGGMPAGSHVVSVGTSSVTMSKAATNFVQTSTFTFSSTGTGATFNFGLAIPLDKQNIAITAHLTTGSNAISSEIVKQEASRRYLVENTEGLGQVKLIASDTLTAGTAKLIATDFGGATYYVTKLTARRATLHSRTNTLTALVSLTLDPLSGITTGATKWTIGSATGTIVTIATY